MILFKKFEFSRQKWAKFTLKNAKIYYSLTMNYCNVINETFLVRSKYVSVGSQRDQRSQIEKLEVLIFAPKIRQQVRPISLAHKVYLFK